MSDVREVAIGRATTNVAVVTTTEKTVVTTEKISPDRPGRSVLLLAFFTHTTGAATDGLTAKIYRGADENGTAVSEASEVAVGASAIVLGHVTALDVLGDVGEVQYALALTQASATGNGSTLDATLVAIVL